MQMQNVRVVLVRNKNQGTVHAVFIEVEDGPRRANRYDAVFASLSRDNFEVVKEVDPTLKQKEVLEFLSLLEPAAEPLKGRWLRLTQEFLDDYMEDAHSTGSAATASRDLQQREELFKLLQTAEFATNRDRCRRFKTLMELGERVVKALPVGAAAS